MIIKIEVPSNIVTTLESYGYSKVACENIVKTFFTVLMHNPHLEFEERFNMWHETLLDEELEEIKKGKLL
jgi:hypothetical protein